MTPGVKSNIGAGASMNASSTCSYSGLALVVWSRSWLNPNAVIAAMSNTDKNRPMIVCFFILRMICYAFKQWQDSKYFDKNKKAAQVSGKSGTSLRVLCFTFQYAGDPTDRTSIFQVRGCSDHEQDDPRPGRKIPWCGLCLAGLDYLAGIGLAFGGF